MPRNATLVVLMLLLLGIVAVIARADDAEEQRRVAEKFLSAYLLRDMQGIKQYIPDKFVDYFGPYPFTGPVKMSQPKVDEHQALVEFTAPVADSKIPARGGILMRWNERWYVRQVLFYDKVPRVFNLPSKSGTAEDKKQEPAVKAVADKFLDAWDRNDTAAMQANWFNWTAADRDPIKGLSMGKTTSTHGTTSWKDGYIQYTTKLTYRYGILSYSMNVQGGLVLCKSGGEWRVRPNVLIFDF